MYSPAEQFVLQGYTIDMNRYVFSLAVIFCALITAGNVALAQTTTSETIPTSTDTPIRNQFTPEPTLPKIAQTRLTNLAANMSNRMDGVVMRLQNVTDRLSSRLGKMEAEGKNVSAARTELAIAQSKLDEAKRNLSTIDSEVNAFIGSATPRENWQNLKNNYLNTRTIIIAAHQSILATINLAQTTTVAPGTSTTTASSTNN